MALQQFIVNAFTEEPFGGNPAAVVPLSAPLEVDLMQAISAQNNLAETAFFVPHGDGAAGHYDLRWFTPTTEVDLCGHATLASAYVVLFDLAPQLERVVFETRSGALTVTRAGEGLAMDFPALASMPLDEAGLATRLGEVLGHEPIALHASVNLIAEYASEAEIRALAYDPRLKEVLDEAGFWGLIVTAPGEEVDFVSRFFAPAKGIAEDPVTGSAHCALTPFWAPRLGKERLKAIQASRRVGHVTCALAPGGRVRLEGACRLFLKGELALAV